MSKINTWKADPTLAMQQCLFPTWRSGADWNLRLLHPEARRVLAHLSPTSLECCAWGKENKDSDTLYRTVRKKEQTNKRQNLTEDREYMRSPEKEGWWSELPVWEWEGSVHRNGRGGFAAQVFLLLVCHSTTSVTQGQSTQAFSELFTFGILTTELKWSLGYHVWKYSLDPSYRLLRRIYSFTCDCDCVYKTTGRRQRDDRHQRRQTSHHSE